MKPTFKKVGFLASGEIVYDRFDSHCKVPPDLLKKALDRVWMCAFFERKEIQFPDTVGVDPLVPTTASDRVYYRVRSGRKGPTRFVKDRSPVPTDRVSLILKRMTGEDIDPDEAVILISAWVGRLAPPEPWDSEATPIDVEFWQTHALIEEKN